MVPIQAGNMLCSSHILNVWTVYYIVCLHISLNFLKLGYLFMFDIVCMCVCVCMYVCVCVCVYVCTNVCVLISWYSVRMILLLSGLDLDVEEFTLWYVCCIIFHLHAATHHWVAVCNKLDLPKHNGLLDGKGEVKWNSIRDRSNGTVHNLKGHSY